MLHSIIDHSEAFLSELLGPQTCDAFTFPRNYKRNWRGIMPFYTSYDCHAKSEKIYKKVE